jgi:hypothetical protein
MFRKLDFLMLRAAPKSPEEERVLNLFRNRAELKKAYGELQKEVYRLKDRIKQQEGATQRAQELHASLEHQLAFAETGYPALVFYQLRRLWLVAHELIEQLVADLSRRQDQRERQQHFAGHHRRRDARLQSADSQLREAERRLAETAAAVADLEGQRASLNRLWHYFKRRALLEPHANAQAEAARAEATSREARASVEAIQKEPVPDFPGLSLEARRAINLAAIAYAEVLCARLSGTRLVKLAREATSQREVSEEYGSRAECEALMEQIERAHALIAGRGSIAQEIRSRTERLRPLCRYRNPADTAPIAESLGPVDSGEGTAGGGTATAEADVLNVLAADMWDLYQVLLR